MRRFIKLSSLIFCYLLFTAGPSSALFGSECKKPKASYEKYLQSAYTQKAKEDKAKAAAEAKIKRDFAECEKNPKAFLNSRDIDRSYPRVKASCVWFKLGLETNYPSQKMSYEEYKNAMLVVSNYKKCFDPEVYINAKKWLQSNK